MIVTIQLENAGRVLSVHKVDLPIDGKIRLDVAHLWLPSPAAEAEGLLREAMYWQPNPMRVLECRWCGAMGPVNETHRKLPPAPHESGCRLAAFLAAGERDKGKEGV